MAFVYYQEMVAEEHMLFAKEIGEMFGITGQKAAKLIEAYCSKNGINVPRLFYKTKYGLARVYPRHVWYPALTPAT